MIRLLPLLTCLLIPAIGLSGCSLLSRKKKRKPTPAAVSAQPIFVGMISLVNADSRFVLIDNGRLPAPPSGAALKSFSGTAESGDLTATEVRKRPFIIADIRAGAPQKGDRVFLSSSAPAPGPMASPEAGSLPDPALLPQLSPGPALDQ